MNTSVQSYLDDLLIWMRGKPLAAAYRRVRDAGAVRRWEEAGGQGPTPHFIKAQIIKAYARQYNIRLLVESGTYLGDMVHALRKDFDRIYSIELSWKLYANASDRFGGQSNIVLMHGDSGIVLETLLTRIDEPCLFWLDGHYSGEITARSADNNTPILAELNWIFRHRMACSHVILIDDSRLFNGSTGYPELETIQAMSKCAGFDRFEIEADVIRISNKLG